MQFRSQLIVGFKGLQDRFETLRTFGMHRPGVVHEHYGVVEKVNGHRVFKDTPGKENLAAGI
jgi:hypothetical protein